MSVQSEKVAFFEEHIVIKRRREKVESGVLKSLLIDGCGIGTGRDLIEHGIVKRSSDGEIGDEKDVFRRNIA